jgi:hypothetical protein
MDGVLAAGSGPIDVTYHQFWLLDSGQRTRPTNALNGLVGVAPPGAAMIWTGIHSGSVTLSVEARAAAPETVDVAGWDEVVEVSLAAPAGHVRPAALMADVPHPFPELTAAGPGDYRIRVHARGRDENSDGVDFEPVEEYLVMAWPAPPAPERIHRQSDAFGAGMRQSAAKARPVRERQVDPVQARIDDFLRRVQDGLEP